MVCLSCWLTCRMFERLQKLLTYIFGKRVPLSYFVLGWETWRVGKLCCMAIYDTCGLLVSLVVWKVLESVHRKHFHIFFDYWHILLGTGPSNLVLKCLGSWDLSKLLSEEIATS